MKKFFISLVAVLAMSLTTEVFAQQNHNVQGNITNEARKKASKDASKEAKKWEKEGWKSVGAGTILSMFEKYYLMSAETDAYYTTTWSFGQSQSSSKIANVARTKTMAMAREDLAANLKTTLTSSFEQQTTEIAHSDEETSAMQKVVTDGMQKVTDQVLTHIIPVVQLMRQQNGQTEYYIVLAYSARNAMEKVLNEQQEEIAKMRPELRAKIEEIRGW